MKKLIFYTLFGLNLYLPISVEAQTSVEEYVQLAIENNPGLKAKFNAYYEALERVAQVGELPDPSVALGAYILPLETRVGSRLIDFEISQSFPWFGTLSAQKDEAAQWAQVKFREFQVSKTELLYEVKALYYQIYSTDVSIRIQKEHLGILERQEKELLTRVEAAKASLADVLRTQMQQKETTAELENLIDYKSTLVSQMNSLLNRPSSTPVNTAQKIHAIDLNLQDQTLLSIMTNNPNIVVLNETTKALESQKELARLAGSPSFNTGLSYGLIQSRSDVDIPNNGQNVLMPKVSLSIPLNRKKYNAKVKEVELMQERLAFKISDERNTLGFFFAKAKNQYRDAQRNTKLYEELTVQANQTLEILTTSYSTELIGYDEILDMQRQLLTYKLELEKAKSNQNIAIAGIEKLMAKGI